MRIAFLLINHIRPESVTIDQLKDNINFAFSEFKNDEIDFFISTWFSENVDFNEVEKKLNPKILDIETDNDYTYELRPHAKEFKLFLDSYRNEDPTYKYFCSDFEDKKNLGKLNHAINIFYKLNRGLKLIKEYELKNNKEYDVIFRSRFDITLSSKFERSHIEEVKNSESMYATAVSYNYLKKIDDEEGIKSRASDFFYFTDGWVDDCFFYSSKKIMDKFTGVYDSLIDISYRHNTWISHVWIREFLKENKIKRKDAENLITVKRPNQGFEVKHFYAHTKYTDIKYFR